jgi:hypothetical protein
LKSIRSIAVVFLGIILTACQPATPAPITATTDTEFTLAPDQTVTIENTDLSIRLIGIAGDERCPLEIECAMSGPVSLTISIQKDSASPIEFNLQSFTDNDGRVPAGQFEGMESQVEFEGYVIQLKSVLPFPQKSFDEIGDSEYRVTFVVSVE